MTDQKNTDKVQRRPRRATMVPSQDDTRLPRQFLETLMQGWIRDAFLLANGTGAGALRAQAAEAAEFGVEDYDRAAALYTDAAKHPDADPRAFAGLRRAAREAMDTAALLQAYLDELGTGVTSSQRVLAAIGAAQMMLRAGRDVAEAIRVLDLVDEELGHVPTTLVTIAHAVREDALVMAGRGKEAVTTRIRRWGELERAEASTPTMAADGALGIAIACEVLGESPERVLDWYGVAFEAEQSVVSARALLRSHFAAEDWSAAEAIVAEVTRQADDLATRQRYRHSLGLVRAYRLDDRSGGLQALSEASKDGAIAPVAATSFLALARSSHGSVMTEELLETLATRLDFCASAIEKADLMTQMAVRLDRELKLSKRAQIVLENALEIAPRYAPALRALGHLYTREGKWESLAKLGEAELRIEENAQERLRRHERLAELYSDKLQQPEQAERHLRSALQIRPHLPVVRRLSRMLSTQMRWQELFDHVHTSAQRVPLIREKVYLLEQAAQIAEQRLKDAATAVAVYAELLHLQPEHPSAVTASGRLLTKLERWTELLELNEFELSITHESVDARVAILCRSAEICERHLGDTAKAETYYQRALDEDATFDEALRGLGKILHRQMRWDELVEMTEREMASAQNDLHRYRCLRQLGELYAVRLNDHERAIDCFEELAQGAHFAREEALVWLERLYEATDAKEQRLETMAKRLEDADDAEARSRLAYRIGELLDWGMGRSEDAFEYYIEALADLTAAPAALDGLDRLWELEDLDEQTLLAALRCAQDVADVAPSDLKRQALTFVAERSAGIWSPAERAALWTKIAEQWPEDAKATEYCALDALQRGDGAAAENYRALRQVGPIRQARTHWAAMDTGVPRDALVALDEVEGPIDHYLARECGELRPISGPMEDRNTFYELGHGLLTLRDLRAGGEGETATRLALYANQALGDGEAVARAGQTLGETLEQPLRAMRAYLDIAALDIVPLEERRRALDEASKFEAYGLPIRDELYDTMQMVEDWDGLEQALVTHLNLATPDATKAASLAARRAMALEVLGRIPEAIDALRYATIHEPADSRISIDKSRLEAAAEQLDQARETLELCLDAGCSGEGRIDVLGRLADLHQMDGGEHGRVISALEDAYQLSGHDAEWALRLANAHAAFGSAARAAELMESALAVPLEQDEVRHWHVLARIYADQLDNPQQAEEILWSVFATFPEREQNLKALERFYRQVGGAAAFTERLATLLAESRLNVSQEGAGRLWLYVGELYFSVLQAFHKAQDAFENARRILGADARNLLREGKATGKMPGKARAAAELLRESLTLAGNDLTVWEEASLELESLNAEVPDPERLRIATQVRRALGANVSAPNDRVKLDPTRELEPAHAWRLIGHGIIREDDRDVLQATAPLAEKVFGKAAPSRREYTGDKLRSEEFNAFATFLDRACRWLDVERPRVIVGQTEGGAQLLDASTVWVSAHAIGDDDPIRARFWAGYVAGLIFTKLATYTWAGDEQTRELLKAVAIRGLDLEVPEGSALEAEVSGLMRQIQRRQAAAALRDNLEMIDRYDGLWSQAALTFADRAGLVACGDVAVAIEEVLAASGWSGELNNPRTREQVVAMPRTRELMLYALSDDYLSARWESGLTPRPLAIDSMAVSGAHLGV